MVSSGLDEIMTVREISKDDVTGQPQVGSILLGDATIDVSTSIAELADRQRIAETYSQGAESIFTDSFVDNADQNNPAEVVFTIPDNVVHVNEIRFSCQLAPFRAYSRAIQGGGGEMISTLDGGSSEPTSSSEPRQDLTSLNNPSKSTSSRDGGGWYDSTQSSRKEYPITESEGGINTTLDIYSTLPDYGDEGGPGSKVHNHGLTRRTRFVDDISITKDRTGAVVDVRPRFNPETWVPSGNHQHRIQVGPHSHRITIDGHTHSFNIPAHAHQIDIPVHDHRIQIPSHNHKVFIKDHSHKIPLPNHVHGIEYGIYKGPRATKYTVYLDDKKIGDYTGNISNLNLIDYMSKNTNGNIMRGKHTIRITPNNLTRIECTFQIRLFTNMHGGKQY